MYRVTRTNSIFSDQDGREYTPLTESMSGANGVVSLMRPLSHCANKDRAKKYLVRKKFHCDTADKNALEKCDSLSNQDGSALYRLLNQALSDLNAHIVLKRRAILFVNKKTHELLKTPGHSLYKKYNILKKHIEIFTDEDHKHNFIAPRLLLPNLGMSIEDLLGLQ
jgi:hypothetical protein